MPRPRDPIAKSVQFHARVTPGEDAAVDEMVRLWAIENPLMGGDRTRWFRALLRREAERQGVPIVEPAAQASAPVSAAPPGPVKTPRKKRSG